MERCGRGRASPPSSSRPKESRGSGSRPSRSAATRGRSPRRSRSPSPRGRRRRRSSSSSRSSRRSPSPRRSSRVRSPSGGSWSRRGSEQRDGSWSRRCSPVRHLSSKQRHPHFLTSYSPSQHSESLLEQTLRTEFNSDFYGIDAQERRRLSDRLGSPDSLSDVDRRYLDDDSVFIRGLSYSRSLEQYRSLQESPPSSFNTRYDKDYRGRDAFFHQSDNDLPRGSDRGGKLFKKSLQLSEEEWFSPKCPRYDREDSLLDMGTDLQGSLSEKRNYYRQRLSSSQIFPDEDFKKFVSSTRNREKEELSENTCQDYPGSGYMIRGLINSLQSSESQYPCRPDEIPAMPSQSILTKQASEQNSGSFLRKKEYQELTSKSADLHDDFFLPHERASQDGSGTSHILDRVTDFTCAQEQRRHSFLDVEDEEKFLYGDDNDDSDISCPTEKLTVNGGKESVSLNKRPLSPKPDAMEGSEIQYEKIHDLLKTIGLDIGVAEIGKGAARTQERLHGKKTLRPQDGPSHKSDTSEKDSIQSNTHSSETKWKNPLSPCDSSQASNDASSTLISEYAKSKTLDYDHSAGPLEQSFPSVSTVTPSAPPLPPNLPPPPPQVSQYALSQFSAFLTARALQNYPPPTMAPPSYNTYRPRVAYPDPAWPMYIPPQQSNPAPPEVHGLVSMPVPSQPTWSNLRVIKRVPKVKEKPEMKRNKSVLVEVTITPTNCKLLPQSSDSGTTKRILDGKNLVSEKPQEFKLGNKISTAEECNKGHGVTVQSGNNSNQIPRGALLLNNLHCEQSQVMDERKKRKAEPAQKRANKKAEKRKKYIIVQRRKKRERLKAQKETVPKRLEYLKTELDRVSRQQGQMKQNLTQVIGYSPRKSNKDPLLKAVNRARRNIESEITRLQQRTEAIEKNQIKPDKFFNENPFCEERSTLDHQERLAPIQETACSLKQCEKQEESKDERSSTVAREEESEITKELGDESDQNKISKEKKDSSDKKLIRILLKKDNIQVEKEEEKKESSQLPSEKCSLKKTETNNQSQDTVVAAPKAESTEKGKCRESRSQSGNQDSKQKVTVTKTQNLETKTEEQKTARVAKVQQQFNNFDIPHCHPSFISPPRPPLSQCQLPGSRLPSIPQFSNSLLFKGLQS
ncbi:zinc finger protein 318-like [Paroedura picta]|uniref:zinc finger protein 318-like n=1 Tax=Paroedura picta TaxID=143630 RepID=UPI004056A4A1